MKCKCKHVLEYMRVYMSVYMRLYRERTMKKLREAMINVYNVI